MRTRFFRSSLTRRRAAVTLIELMIVVVILGILATLIMPRILDAPERARRAKAKAQIANFESALALFKADTGSYPTTSDGLAALVNDPGLKGWKKGGYLDKGKVPKDPWGKDYVYLCPGQGGRDFDILCYGRDGEAGGSDADADVKSWEMEAD